jgi:hypothetical protein
MSQDFDFSKFITDIVEREQQQAESVIDWQKGQDEHPARIYNRLYRELPQNRTRWGRR